MRVLIADDHALFRGGLRAVLESRGIEVLAEAGNGQEAVQLAGRLHPDVVLMDVQMPVLSGLDATRLISAAQPDVRVVILTGSTDEDDLFEAIKSGAVGYLLKDLNADELVSMLDCVMRGDAALTPYLAKRLLTEFAKKPGPQATARRHGRASDELTEREIEVLQVLAQGLTTDVELAERLVVSPNTVKYHLRNILAKLHLRDRAQVVAYAFRHGLVGNPPVDS